MKLKKLLIKSFILLSLVFTSCISNLQNKGLYEIQYNDIKQKNIKEVNTYFDGFVYLKNKNSYIKIFPKSDLKFENGNFELNSGMIINIKKGSKILNKIENIFIDEKLFFYNQIGYAQFVRIKLPAYLKNFKNSVKLEYFKDDNKINSINCSIYLLSKNKYDNFYGFFIPLNINWETNNLTYTVDLFSDNDFNIKIIKKININMVPYKKDIVIFDAKKTNEYFGYDLKKIAMDSKIENDIWKEDNPLLYFLNGYDYPINGNFEISSLFGEERILKGYNGVIMSNGTHHTGMDIPKPKGELLHATCDGKVRFARHTELFGNAIIIEHGFSFFSTFYHLNKIYIKENDMVKKGDVLGEIGSTGDSTGPHLHWEVRIDGIPINPVSFFGIEDLLN